MADAVADTHAAHRWQALAVLVMGACIIGLAAILVRLSDAGPVATGFWRLVFATPLLALMAQRAGGLRGAPSKWALLAGVFFALDLGFWHYGIQYTSVANATVLPNLTPVVVTAFAWIFLRQRPRALFLVAVAAAVVGASMMAIGKTGGTPRNQPLGDALSLFTAFWYALYFLAITEGRKGEGASRIMFWAGLAGAPLLLAAGAVMGEQLVPVTTAGWLACLGLGLMHVTGQGSIAWAMGRLPTPTASVVVLVQPVVAAALGYLLFAEHIGPLQGLGAAVTLGGVVLAQWASRARPA
ncbi:DMT family transporter [Phenylobacterium sp.]|uniref:DMT family transporter n=1 Tax=Phenylobacterium sp. TaxID=1871053 RepID=UPI002EDA31EE